ncbi:MAG TPA: phage protein Gp27 family protein, partial [Polyangiaceae bacterium]|nr:phage protein Gp27 family protein [Polyangiaceae bacterium]
MTRRKPLRGVAPEIKREIDRLLSDEKMTITQITDRLRGLGANVSRSAVGRYAQVHERMASDIR